MPWFFIQLRYMKPFLSAAPNHWAERRGRFASDIDFFLNRLLFQDFIRSNASGVRDLFCDCVNSGTPAQRDRLCSRDRVAAPHAVLASNPLAHPTLSRRTCAVPHAVRSRVATSRTRIT